MGQHQNEIDILVRSRYPILYVVSWEEGRVESFLNEMASRQNKTLFLWTSTQGLTESAFRAKGDCRTPEAVLDFITKYTNKAIFVLKDFHPHLQDPQIVRRLRDLVGDLKSSFKTLILVGPVLQIPPELEKDISVVDFDLPGVEEMSTLIADVLKVARESGRFKINLSSEDQERIVQSSLGMTLSEAENALARAIVGNQELTVDQVEETLLQETKQIIRKSRLLEYFEAQENIHQVGGMSALKNWLNKRGQAFSERARAFGLPQPRGVLLLGVQGCGKSLTCKVISGLWKLPLLRLDMGSIFGQFVGQSEENMRRAIRVAESVAPCVLWLDEIEKGLAGTQSSGATDGGATARVFSTFLTWLQEKTKPVFVAATANDIRALPPELLRKGRLDEIFFIDLPRATERREILAIHLRRKKRNPEAFDLDKLTALTDGFSGAELEQLIVSALYDAFAAGRELQLSDLETAATATIPLSTTMREDIAALRDWASTRARPATPTE